MPLPKPPARPGDMLRAADFEAQAAPKADKRALKPRAAAAAAPVQAALELNDSATAVAAQPPQAAPKMSASASMRTTRSTVHCEPSPAVHEASVGR